MAEGNVNTGPAKAGQPAQPPNQQGRPPQQAAGQKPVPQQGQPQKFPPKPQFQKPAAPLQKEENPNFRGIVRIAGKDMDGHFSLYKGLIRVRGIGSTLARALERVIRAELNLKGDVRVGDLSEEQISRVDEILRSPSQHGIKAFMLNRQRDRDSGKNLHLLMNELAFAQKQDMQLERDNRSYKGWRFSLGQRVRGQHNRTTGRTGFTVGVLKKAIKEQKAAAAAGAQDKGKPAAEKKK